MGKASSKKKVARAARAGGGRARAAGERNVVFPLALASVVVLGTMLVVYARDERQAQAELPPLAFEDHWHSSYGYFICDDFLPAMPEFTAPQNGGTHTHGDGLLHIHPFSTARSGDQATLANFVKDAAEVLGGSDEISSDTLGVPGVGEYKLGDDTCEGVDGDPVVQVLYWEDASAGLDGAAPIVFTDGFDDIRFEGDGEAFVLAFAPEGADIGLPPATSGLSEVSPEDLGVDDADLPDELQDDETSTTLSDAESRAEEESDSTDESGDEADATDESDASDDDVADEGDVTDPEATDPDDAADDEQTDP